MDFGDDEFDHRMTGYKRCCACWRVFEDPNGEYWHAKLPCPLCQREHKLWHVWPPTATSGFLAIAAQQDVGAPDALKIATVFTCTAVETLLEDLVEGLLWKDTRSGRLVQLVLEAHSSIPRREALFRSIRKVKLSAVMAQSSHPSFYPDWRNLVELRNGLIHGDYWAGMTDVWPVNGVADGCVKVFKFVNNDAWDYIEKQDTAAP